MMPRTFPDAPLRNPSEIVDGLARLEPRGLACMHGSSYRGDGTVLLRSLRDALGQPAQSAV